MACAGVATVKASAATAIDARAVFITKLPFLNFRIAPVAADLSSGIEPPEELTVVPPCNGLDCLDLSVRWSRLKVELAFGSTPHSL